MIVVASAHSPNAPPKVLFDFIPVGIDGSKGFKALDVAPLLLIAYGMLPSSTPHQRLFFLLVCCCLHLALFSVLVSMVGWEGECYMFALLVDLADERGKVISRAKRCV